MAIHFLCISFISFSLAYRLDSKEEETVVQDIQWFVANNKKKRVNRKKESNIKRYEKYQKIENLIISGKKGTQFYVGIASNRFGFGWEVQETDLFLFNWNWIFFSSPFRGSSAQWNERIIYSMDSVVFISNDFFFVALELSV